MIRRDRVHATTLVDVEPDVAFEIFTVEIDAWWGKGPRFRPGLEGKGVLRFEPHVGGRLLEIYEGREVDAFEFGQVKVWEPPERIVLDLGGRDFAPDEWTEVEIRFSAEGQATRIDIEHRGFRKLAPDHPVRHGMDDHSFYDMMGLWWGDLLAQIARYGSETPR